MPADSIAQANFMALAEHHPEKLKGKVPKMSKAQMHDFAATPRAGLPEHVADRPKPKRNSYRRRTK